MLIEEVISDLVTNPSQEPLPPNLPGDVGLPGPYEVPNPVSRRSLTPICWWSRNAEIQPPMSYEGGNRYVSIS